MSETKSNVVLQPQAPGEEVVISGMSGRFPDSANVLHFKENLLNKVDMVTGDDRRWFLDHPEIPQRTGKLLEVSKFDADFFKIKARQSHSMDPLARMLLEVAVETLVDAGIHPDDMRGTRTGVIVGACFSESEKNCIYDNHLDQNGMGIVGCSRSMLANRVSQFLGVYGPSYAVDSACSSSLMAIEHGYRAIRNGYCDQALIGGANLCLHPFVSLQFSRLGVLNPDGECRSFDERARGYARSEGVSFILLQQAKDAKRIYAQLVHAKSNCDGYKEQGITFPSGAMQAQLLREAYQECGVDPREVMFMEAHGTGTRVGDPEEIRALDEVFCTGRTDPLPIGSVKSNIGHGEPASGISSVVKVCLALETGKIPPNLHYESPREGVAALHEGRMTVVTDPQDFDGGYVGINSFGFGGANVHVLLKSPDQIPAKSEPQTEISYLVCVSGRTKSAVDTLLDGLHQKSSVLYPKQNHEDKLLNPGIVHLVQSAYKEGIPGHQYRGYSVLDLYGNEISRSVAMMDEITKREVVFVFSGAEFSATLARSLLRFPIFKDAIEECNGYLETYDIDLMKIIEVDGCVESKNLMNVSVAAVAVQLGLVEFLKSLNVTPTMILGHTMGELMCAYTDGCLTMEQTILAAYFRTRVLTDLKIEKTTVAIIHRSPLIVSSILTQGAHITSHLSSQSTIVSGLPHHMNTFLRSLNSKRIEYEIVQKTPAVNYHNELANRAGPGLLSYYQRLMPDTLERSTRWISTSANEDSSHCAMYHVNSLLQPVKFAEACSKIPSNSVCVEISSGSELKSAIEDLECVSHIGFNVEDGRDACDQLLDGLGRLHCLGVNPKVSSLYQPQWPVQRGTPMLGHLVEWDHAKDWYVTSYRTLEKLDVGERNIEMSTLDQEHEYLTGHVIDGRNLFPATGYLTVVWETFAMMRGAIYTEVPVIFEDIRFIRATNISKDGLIDLEVMIQKGSGRFEVSEGGSTVVTGMISATGAKNSKLAELPPRREPERFPDTIPMGAKDVYKELRLRGYNYSGAFKGVLSYDPASCNGSLYWGHNWVTFMDCMMQLQILCEDTRGLFVPTSITRLQIDTRAHIAQIYALGEDRAMPVEIHPDIGIIRSGGVEICGLKASAISRKKPAGEPVLEKHIFVPNHTKTESVDDAIRCIVQLALENVPILKVKVFELVDKLPSAPAKDDSPSEIDYLDVNSQEIPLTPIMRAALEDLPLIQSDLTLLAEKPLESPAADLGQGINLVEDKKIPADAKCSMIIGTGLLGKKEALELLLASLRPNGFILTREAAGIENIPAACSSFNSLNLVCSYRLPHETLVLLQRKNPLRPLTIIKIDQNDETFAWLDEVKTAVKNADNRILLVVENQPLNGVMGLVNCIRKEPGGDLVRCLVISDSSAPGFDAAIDLYKNQLDLDLALNIFKNGAWGTYRHLQIRDCVIDIGHSYSNVITRGDLSSLRWIEGPLRAATKTTKTNANNLIYVYYCALNFRDVMTATGKIAFEVVSKGRLNQTCVQGLEYAGRNIRGERVMGLVGSGALATLLDIDPLLSWTIPSHWTLQDAATVPVVYATAYYALYLAGDMRPGQTVLIHAGSGGVGQAAINIALHAGCHVITTVGTEEKRKFLLERFPDLDEEDIGNSRDTTFEQLVMRRTRGKGVDIVLNSLAESKLLASLRCLGTRGRFLEIGKFDLASNNMLGLGTFMDSRSFHGVALESLFNAELWEKQRIGDMLSEGIKSGAVRPLSRQVFERDEIEQAFRYMAAGKHIGKVLLKMREEEDQEIIVPEDLTWLASPRVHCSPDRSYVIVGGLGGFGLELADWLAMRGARHLVLSSRSGLKSGYQASRIRAWRSYGISVDISTADITTRAGCCDLLRSASAVAPVAGLFNLAVVLEDAILENQTPEKFSASLAPKAVATKYLDQISSELCPELEHFVVFSSVSCGRGNAGQSNYGMSNSVMERICESRSARGLPAVAVQWGAVGEVGLVADMQDDHKELEIGGTLQQRIGSCLEALDILLSQSYPVVASMVVAEKRATGAGGAGGIVPTVLNILGLRDLRTVSPHSTLAELGMDSLMAVEIKQALEREFEVFLTPQDIRALTFARLSELAAAKDNSADQIADGVASAVSKTGANASGGVGGGAIDPAHGFVLLMEIIGSESQASLPVIRLPSLAERPLVFAVPGVEGAAAVLSTMARGVRARVECLQLPVPQQGANIQEMANFLMPHLVGLQEDLSRTFNIVAYSFGSLPMLEALLDLEAQGARANVILLDGAPAFMKGLVDMHVSSDDANDERYIQAHVLLAMRAVLSPGGLEAVKEALILADSWEARVDAMVNSLPDEGKKEQHSRKYVRDLCEAMLVRSRSAKYNDTSRLRAQKIKSRVTLVKPTELSLAHMAHNYDLDEFLVQELDIRTVEGNHRTMLDNPKCSEIINEVLGLTEETLESKKSSNEYVIRDVKSDAEISIQ